jgi:ureidoglycolate lyase
VSTLELAAVPLTAAAFAAFGDVVQAGDRFALINRGTTRMYADLAKLDVDAQGGSPRVSLYRVAPCELPLTIRMLERHPLSSQLFVPLDSAAFLVVVAPPGADVIDSSAIRAFVTDGHQGVNYRRGTWHHPVIALTHPTEFLVVDRAGAGRNCDEFHFGDEANIVVSIGKRP